MVSTGPPGLSSKTPRSLRPPGSRPLTGGRTARRGVGGSSGKELVRTILFQDGSGEGATETEPFTYWVPLFPGPGLGTSQ